MKYSIVFFSCLLSLFLGACANRHTPTPLVYANWHLEKRALQEKSEQPFYQIDVHYPEIVSQPHTDSTQQLNQLIRTFIADRIQTFKQTAPQNKLRFDGYPAPLLDNAFRITYSATLIKPRHHTIVSIRFETDTLFLGEIHHLHQFAVVNYDLTQGKRLTLDDLFKPGSPYLLLLAQSCQEQLSNRFTQGMPWLPWNGQGSLPRPENFKIWNLEQKGLLITFQEDQVAPYSSLPQTILVPYTKLRAVLAPDAPITAYAF